LWACRRSWKRGDAHQIDGFDAATGRAWTCPRATEAAGSGAATGKPLVVVLQSGSAVALNWANQHANAILEAWYPGVEGGSTIARTLAGVNNPAGRLPSPSTPRWTGYRPLPITG